MEQRRWVAAGGSLALHAAMVAAAVTLAGQQPVRVPVRPVEVVLIPAPEQPRPAAAPASPPASPLPAPPPPAPALPAPRPAPPKPPPPKPVPRPAPAPKAPAPRPIPDQVPAAPAVDAPGTPKAPAVDTTPAPGQPAAGPSPGPAAAAPNAPAAPAAPSPAPPAAPSAGPQRAGPRLDASWSGNAPPPYPAMARRMGDQGEVRLDIHVGADGSVLEVRLRKSSGSQLLDRTAIDTVKKWRFRPATVDGRPVPEWYQDWKWVFKLEN